MKVEFVIIYIHILDNKSLSSHLQLALVNRVAAYFESKVYPTSKIGNKNTLKLPIIS